VLEKARKEFITDENKNSHLATCIDHSWHLFNKYYKLTDRSRAYVMATVLDPRNKYQYFYDKWNKKHWAGMRRKTESMFEEFRTSDDVAASADISESSMSDSNLDLLEEFDISRWRFGNGEQSESELERYLKSPLMVLPGKEANASFNVLEWWKANKAEYPTLFRIAVELFSIPDMSAEVERTFSGCVPRFIPCLIINDSAKQTITDRRNRLEADSIECVECLHHWLASDIISGVSSALTTDGLIILDE
jgi:hAT family C-terminal dimerisation region